MGIRSKKEKQRLLFQTIKYFIAGVLISLIIGGFGAISYRIGIVDNKLDTVLAIWGYEEGGE